MHLRKLLFALPLVMSASAGYAQLQINGGSSFSVLAGTTVLLEEGMTVQAAATISNAGSISLKRDLINNGTANFIAPGEIIFNGTVPQALSSTSPLTVSHAVINNAAGVNFTAEVTVADSLSLLSGVLNADAATPLHFGVFAHSPAETNNSYITGRAIMDQRQVGNSGIDNFLGYTMNPGVSVGDVTIIRNTGADAVINIINNQSVHANWTINTTTPIAAGGRDVAFSWLSVFDNNRDVTKLDLYASKDVNLYEKLNDTSADVSVTDPRMYVQAGIKKFNRLFTFTDSLQSLSVPSAIVNTTDLKVYPNPFRDICYVQLTKSDNDPVYIYLSDISGKVVLREHANVGNEAVIELKNLNALVPGVYLLHVGNEHFSKSYKILKAE